MTKRERVALRRFEAGEDSTEGKLFRYVNTDPNLIPREAVLRALKAFYLPWVLESQARDSELRAIAKTSIQELQYRIFQIQQWFLPGEFVLAASTTPSLMKSTMISLDTQPKAEETVFSMTLAEMRDEVDLEDLDQFLDDF